MLQFANPCSKAFYAYNVEKLSLKSLRCAILLPTSWSRNTEWSPELTVGSRGAQSRPGVDSLASCDAVIPFLGIYPKTVCMYIYFSTQLPRHYLPCGNNMGITSCPMVNRLQKMVLQSLSHNVHGYVFVTLCCDIRQKNIYRGTSVNEKKEQACIEDDFQKISPNVNSVFLKTGRLSGIFTLCVYVCVFVFSKRPLQFQNKSTLRGK